MTIEHELLEAILADRDDRDAYRVYADYLEQRGDPRGQLIAMELRAEETQDLDLLLAIQEHVRRHPALAPSVDLSRVSFRWKWGLIVEASLRSPGPEELARVLSHPASVALASLLIEGHALELGPVLANLAQARPTLENLVVRYTRPPAARFDGLVGTPGARGDDGFWDRVPNLVRLEIAGPFVGFAIVPAIRSNLRELVVAGMPFSEDDVWDLPAVTRIEWHDVDSIDQLAPLWRSTLPALRALSIETVIWQQRFFEHGGFMGRVARLDDVSLVFRNSGSATSVQIGLETLAELRREMQGGHEVCEAWARMVRRHNRQGTS